VIAPKDASSASQQPGAAAMQRQFEHGVARLRAANLPYQYAVPRALDLDKSIALHVVDAVEQGPPRASPHGASARKRYRGRESNPSSRGGGRAVRASFSKRLRHRASGLPRRGPLRVVQAKRCSAVSVRPAEPPRDVLQCEELFREAGKLLLAVPHHPFPADFMDFEAQCSDPSNSTIR